MFTSSSTEEHYMFLTCPWCLAVTCALSVSLEEHRNIGFHWETTSGGIICSLSVSLEEHRNIGFYWETSYELFRFHVGVEQQFEKSVGVHRH